MPGVSLGTFMATASEAARRAIRVDLRHIVSAAHAASVYDLDLHPTNIIVRTRSDGFPQAVLFDFNKIPSHEWPPNPLARWLVGIGWIGPESRDWRRLQAVAGPAGRRLRHHAWRLFT